MERETDSISFRPREGEEEEEGEEGIAEEEETEESMIEEMIRSSKRGQGAAQAMFIKGMSQTSEVVGVVVEIS